MADQITQEDLLTVLRHSADPGLQLNIEVLDAGQKVISTLNCAVLSGNMTISGDADVRRTASFIAQPTWKEQMKLTENSLLWLNKDIRLSIGLYNAGDRQYRYYPLGHYVYTDTAGTYDAAANQLTINCSDFMKKLDGTKNGQLGALLLSYPACEQNPETGEIIRHNTIRSAVIETLEHLAGITNHKIDDIGEPYAMPEHNDDWQKYREENPDTWNTIPFDQEFSAGCSILSVLTTFRDLYPGYEMFFDMEHNTFVCQMIPSCYEDGIFLDNTFIQRVLISENTSVDMTDVKNICEVRGQIIETDFYSENCACTGNIYTAAINGYDTAYRNGDIVALKIPEANQNAQRININNLGAIAICDEGSDKPLSAGRLKADNIYAFKIRKRRIDKQDVIKACLLGQWQVHALNVLADGSKSTEKAVCDDGTEYERYSPEYFKKFYQCEHVELTIIPDSPFTVQKLGEILDVKTGGEYENITSDDLALDRAKLENRKNCRLTDHITITTVLLPFLDVNKKISYRRSDSDREHQYIISSVSHDFSGYTTTITMYRFYPLYGKKNMDAGSHRVISGYTHEELGRYTHEQLASAAF